LIRDVPDLDPRRLLVFRAVARAGSLSRAAAELGWTQPAVGQHVQRLEREAGLALVLRNSRGITLTDAGSALLLHADAVAGRLDAAAEQLHSLRTLGSGRLRIAAFPSAAATLVPPALASLAVTAAGVEVRLEELEPPEAWQAVLGGEVDLALLFHYPGDRGPDEHRDLTTQPVLDEPTYAVLPATHPLARQRTVSLGRLAGERWVAGCERCRTHLVTLADGAGFVPDIRHSTDDYVVVQNLVAADLAVALLPRLALTAAPDDRVAAVRVAGDSDRRVSLVHRTEALGVPAVGAGVEALLAAARPHRNTEGMRDCHVTRTGSVPL
jgi:DNA-binding transcriptional LysR family regulator